MKEMHLRIALEKARTDEEKEALEAILPSVLALERYEATLIERIHASKAKRGEEPTRLRKGKREEIDSYAQDAIEIDKEVVKELQKMNSAKEIVDIFRSPLKTDIQYLEGTLKYYHPDELHLGEEGLTLKRQLSSAIDAFLEAHPGNGKS